MAESTADATAANADTLRLELEKTMTEIVDEGGALKEIDKAMRILNRLRVIEWKNLEPNIPCPSRKVKVPKEFKCPLSCAIMSEPVVIASGQTYEKRYIKKWLANHQTCPITKEAVPYCILTRNHLIDDLITQWCRDNEHHRPKPSEYKAMGMMCDGIDSLLHLISSPSVEDQKKAAKELCRQIQGFENVRAFFYAEMPHSLRRLLSPVSAFGSNPEVEENIITALHYILGFAEDITLVAQQIPRMIPLLHMLLKQGTTAKTRESAAAALASLSRVHSYRVVIGNSNTRKHLIDAFKDGNGSAGIALFNLCLRWENCEMAVSEGLVTVLANKIKARSHVELILKGLSEVMFKYNRVIEEMEDLGLMDDLFSILRNPSSSKTAEKALELVFRMCCLDTAGDRNRESTRRELVGQEERRYGTFSKLATQGSGAAVTIAKEILKSGTPRG